MSGALLSQGYSSPFRGREERAVFFFLPARGRIGHPVARPEEAVAGRARGGALFRDSGTRLALPSRVRPCYIFAMNSDSAIATLRRHESALRARGVLHAAVFGSVASGENRPDSDLDILVEFEPGSQDTIFDYIRFKEYVAGLFEVPVDVIDRAGLKPHLRAPAAHNLIYAF